MIEHKGFTMIKILLSLLMALSLYGQTPTYEVNYRGMTLGEITDLSTIKDLYLKAKVTSRMARFMLGEDYLVYFAGEKPREKDSKFKRDKKMMLYAFSESLKEKPKYKRYDINDIKYITLRCDSQVCQFEYRKNEKIDGKGKIIFDKDGEFVSIEETKSHFKIQRK